MRILTKSPFEKKGLIAIVEASDNVAQTVVFCIPIDVHDSDRIRDLNDFKTYFSEGVYTKIKDRDHTTVINLKYVAPRFEHAQDPSRSKFVANVKGHNIDFYLSTSNCLSTNTRRFNIEYFYSGKYLSEDFFHKRFIIVEPDWQQLDRLFLEQSILFVDWK
ncbi:hypothetical protein ACVW0P_004329 [Mucilaginibacter sp. UYNi724]